MAKAADKNGKAATKSKRKTTKASKDVEEKAVKKAEKVEQKPESTKAKSEGKKGEKESTHAKYERVKKGSLYLRLDKQAAFKEKIKVVKSDPIHIRMRFRNNSFDDIADFAKKLGWTYETIC